MTGPEGRGRPIRVTHLITDSGTGGAEKILFELVSRLDREQCISRVITIKKPGATAEKIKNAGVEVESLGMPATAGPAYPLLLLPAALRLSRMLRADPPDVLHCWLFQANVLGRLAARAAGLPANISSLRVVEMEKNWQYPIDRITSTMVTRYVAVCDAVAGHYRRKLGLDPQRIVTVPNGVDPGPFQGLDRPALRRELGVPEDGLVVGSAGRLHFQKGFDLLLKAWPRILAEFPGAELLIAGDGPERGRLESMAGPGARFLGEWSRMPELMGALDLFVLPSRWEGMPNVVLEAMAAGLPVVAARVGGAPELVVEGSDETGVLVEPGGSDALGRAMLSLLGDPDRRKRMGERAEAAVEKYSMERMVGRYLDLYSGLLNSPV